MSEPEHGAVHQEDHATSRCWVGGLNCLLLSCLYVGSLYIWRSSLPRDHPSVIKRRCVSVLLVSVLSPAVVKTWIHWSDVRVVVTVWELMGIRLDGLVPAAVLPLLLTMFPKFNWTGFALLNFKTTRKNDDLDK